MPFKSQGIKIEGTQYDRRRKLTEQDKADIKELVGISIHEIARMYGVCTRTIQFIKYPERQERNKMLRKARGGSKIYYNKEQNTIKERQHRRYKQDLMLANKIHL